MEKLIYYDKWLKKYIPHKPVGINDIYEKLGKLEELQIDDRLVELPCKVGDTVYIVGEHLPAEIEEIRITPQGIFFEYVQLDRGPELTEVWDYGSFYIDEIGKNVFFTREEAEAALKGGE